MSTSISQVERQALATLLGFLASILPASFEIVRGQDNRVPEPDSDDFVVMTPMLREPVGTTITTYPSPDGEAALTRMDWLGMRLTVQLDFHGPRGGDGVTILGTLFRTSLAVNYFRRSTGFPGAPIDATPLYCSDPRQLPFINGESQYEERWSIDVVMQVNPVVTTVEQSATVVTTGVISVEATYPAGDSS